MARAEHVEDKHASRPQGPVDAPEDALQPPLLVLRVEQVVEDLAHRRDGVARRYGHLEQRSHPELGPRRLLSGDLDHGRGDVDSKHPAPGPKQFPRPQPTAAPEVDHQPVRYPVISKYSEDAGRGAEGEVGVAYVVNVGEVLPVEAGHAVVPRVSLAADPGGGRGQRDGLLVDGLVQAV